MLDLFRDGFCICGGPFGSGMWKNWKVAALKYFRPVTYMACTITFQSEPGFIEKYLILILGNSPGKSPGKSPVTITLQSEPGFIEEYQS